MSPQRRPSPLPLLFLAIYLIWGFTYVATKIALRDVGPFTLAAARSILGALALAAAARRRRRHAGRHRPGQLPPLTGARGLGAARYVHDPDRYVVDDADRRAT